MSARHPKTILRHILNGSSLLMMLLASPAFAQDVNSGLVDPGRTQQQLLDQRKLEKLSPSFEVKQPIIQAAPEGAENITFVLKSLEIEGVTAYQSNEIDPLYRDRIGQTVSLADIYDIASQMTNKYRNQGYILTQVYVPPQTIDSGIVKLKVLEGFVDKIIVQGEQSGGENQLIEKYAGNVKAKSALNAKDLERNLLLINDLPGVTARAILSPSTTTIGASDLTLIVERDRHEAELGFNNEGSRYLGAYQGLAKGSLNSVLGNNELITGQAVLAGDNENPAELGFGSILYEQPINRYGTKAQALASYTRTEPGYDLEEFDVVGRSEYLKLGATHPVIRSRDLNLETRGYFDYRNVNSSNDLEPTRKDRVRALRAGATLQFIDTFIGIAVNAFDVEVAQGIDVLGASDAKQDNLTRELGRPKFTKANVIAQRLQRLTPKTNLLIATSGQLSADPLLSAEEFGVGGMDIGRGYDSSEIVGDDGISGKLELQVNKPVEINELHDYQLFTFLDSGRVWNQDATASADKRDSLTSLGFGIRADITQQTKAGLAIAIPLTREVETRDDKEPRIYFSLNHEF